MSSYTLGHVGQHCMCCISQDYGSVVRPPGHRCTTHQWPFERCFDETDDLLQTGRKYISKGWIIVGVKPSTHRSSHPWNSLRISLRAVVWSQVDGSVLSGCERTMLKDLPPPMVYVMTCRWSPTLVIKSVSKECAEGK